MSAAHGAPPFDVRCYVAEAVGTAILVLVGPGAAMVAAAPHAFGHVGVALAFGLVVLMVALIAAIIIVATRTLGSATANALSGTADAVAAS